MRLRVSISANTRVLLLITRELLHERAKVGRLASSQIAGPQVRQTDAMPQMVTPPPTERLRFRRYTSSDVHAVVEMFADEEAKRWYPTKSQPEEAGRWIQWNLRNYEQYGVGLWAIEDRATGAFLGDCGLTYQTVEGDQFLEIGYHLQHRHQGHGYGLESAQGCADFALRDLRSPTVCAIVDRGGSPKRVLGSGCRGNPQLVPHVRQLRGE